MGPRMPPMAEAAATPEPEMAPKSMLATMLVWAREPGSLWANIWAHPINRLAMPPLFMMLPASTKKGMASREKELAPVKVRLAAVIMACWKGRTTMTAAAAPAPMERPMGKPRASMMTMDTTMTRAAIAACSIIQSPPLTWCCRRLCQRWSRRTCSCGTPGKCCRWRRTG